MTDHGGQWHAIHIFYAAAPRPMLTDCIAPLIRDLRRRGILERYFFINYWLEGPHVRLRLKPVDTASTDEVLHSAEAAIAAFLAKWPALYETDQDYQEFSAKMYRLEYTDEDRVARYGAGTALPVEQNNAFRRRPYEPEYDKYGGPDGVTLAEWHFEHSSDLVLELCERINVHVRSVTLGTAAQLMTIMASTFLPNREQVGQFFNFYYDFWSRSFELASDDRAATYARNYLKEAAGLGRRLTDIADCVQNRQLDRLTTYNRAWAAHAAELHDRVTDLALRGQLAFIPRDGTVQHRVPMTDAAAASWRLLLPYLHMTNNRLGATVLDEAYLSYLIARTLEAEHPPIGAAR